MRSTLPVVEIFSSIQGEARNSGKPTTFIRLRGCNLSCSFCDTRYANTPHSEAICDEIREEVILLTVAELGNKNICITGGEPMIHDNVSHLAYSLGISGYSVEIETNGSIPLYDHVFRKHNPRIRFIMDIKTPSSGMDKMNLYSNVSRLTDEDDIVIVISDEADYQFAKLFIFNTVFPRKLRIYLSPVNLPSQQGKSLLPSLLANWLIRDKLPNTFIQLQLHKLIDMK